jgi:hypothetical protein
MFFWLPGATVGGRGGEGKGGSGGGGGAATLVPTLRLPGTQPPVQFPSNLHAPFPGYQIQVPQLGRAVHAAQHAAGVG